MVVQCLVVLQVVEIVEGVLQLLWFVGSCEVVVCGLKQFVDFQNDVVVVDILFVVCEGFELVEYVKCYMVMGFGIDQGKFGNINGMVIFVGVFGKMILEMGMMMFCLNYMFVLFGMFVGCEMGDFFDLICKMVVYEWYVEYGVMFEDVGNWKWLWYFLKNGEDFYVVVKCECFVVCNGVGIFDVLMFGKIDIQGLDVVKLLNWMYMNLWNKFEIGKCCYGLMFDENGMVFDDGVIVCFVDQYFMMMIIIGGVVCVLMWFECWLQIEWFDMKVWFVFVIDYWVMFVVVGLKSCKVVQKVCQDIDFGNEVFLFMSYCNGMVVGVKVCVMWISFLGEFVYEVNVLVNVGCVVWEVLMVVGVEFDIMLYGMEMMYVLCVEKGYIIVGQDIDGLIMLYDFGMGGFVVKLKDFFGKCLLLCLDIVKEGCKQFVGLLIEDEQFVLLEGVQIVVKDMQVLVVDLMLMIGYVMFSYYSLILKCLIVFVVVKGGLNKMGESVVILLVNGKCIIVKILSLVFYDIEGVCQYVE